MVGSSIFLILQSIILIDFTRSFSEDWIDRFNQSRRMGIAAMMICLTIIAYSLSILAAVWIYMFYSSVLSISAVSINIFLSVVFSAISINHKVQKMNAKTGILPSAVLSLYNCMIYSINFSVFDKFCSYQCNCYPIFIYNSNHWYHHRCYFIWICCREF